MSAQSGGSPLAKDGFATSEATIPSPGSRRSGRAGAGLGAQRECAHARRAAGRCPLPGQLRPRARNPPGARPHSRWSASAPTASTISGRTPTTCRGIVRRTTPGQLPHRRIRNGRRCSTSTRSPPPRAGPGSIRACNACRRRNGAASSASPTAAATPMSCASSTFGPRSFVEGGFVAARGQAESSTWEDADTIAGRPRLGAGDDDRVGLSVRHQAAAARPGARPGRGGAIAARPSDVRAAPMVLRDSDGRVHGIGAYRGVDFFHRQTILFRPGGNVDPQHPAARQRSPGSSTGGCWSRSTRPGTPAPGLHFATDSLVSYDLAEWERDPLGARPSLVWAPGPRQTLSGDQHDPRQAARRHPRQCPRPRLRVGLCERRAGARPRSRCRATPRSASPPRPTRTTQAMFSGHRLSDPADALSL